jgi:hypothetical protein
MLRQSFTLRLATFFGCLSLAVTISHVLSYILSPYEIENPGGFVWLWILLFQFLLTATAWFGCRTILRPLTASKDLSQYEALVHCSTFRNLLVVSSIGVTLHLIAKWPLIEQIEPGCFGQLRGLWLAVDHSTQPLWQRVTSMGGHVLANFYLPGIFMGAFAITSGLSFRRGVVFLACFLTIGVAYALAIVSRSAVLTMLVVSLLSVGLALTVLESGFQRALFRGFSLLSAVLVIALAFNYLVFSSKIECGVSSVEEYSESNAASMSIRKKQAFLLGDFDFSCDVCRPTSLYLNHGVWNFQMIAASKERGDPVLQRYLMGYLARLGMASRPNGSTRVYGAGGTTLPGAAFHDYGNVGIVMTALFLALMFVFSVALIRHGGQFLWLGVALFVAVGVSEAMSLLFFAPATLSFPFLVIAFLTTAAMARRHQRVP